MTSILKYIIEIYYKCIIMNKFMKNIVIIILLILIHISCNKKQNNITKTKEECVTFKIHTPSYFFYNFLNIVTISYHNIPNESIVVKSKYSEVKHINGNVYSFQLSKEKSIIDSIYVYYIEKKDTLALFSKKIQYINIPPPFVEVGKLRGGNVSIKELLSRVC